MQEQPRRKPRIPLSPEELFYVIEVKKIKEAQKLEKFKSTNFFKVINRLNIFFAAFLTYCMLSIFILNTWNKTYILGTICDYGAYDPVKNKRNIARIQIRTISNEIVIVSTSDLYTPPKRLDEIYLGKDLLFGKTIKVKFLSQENIYWTISSYAFLTVSTFALVLGFFIYKLDRHLTVNGLLMALGLFFAASIYFILV